MTSMKKRPTWMGRIAAALLVLAAFIEAFWSSRELAPQIKYGVGAACWALLALYLLFAGRRRQGGRHGPE